MHSTQPRCSPVLETRQTWPVAHALGVPSMPLALQFACSLKPWLLWSDASTLVPSQRSELGTHSSTQAASFEPMLWQTPAAQAVAEPHLPLSSQVSSWLLTLQRRLPGAH